MKTKKLTRLIAAGLGLVLLLSGCAAPAAKLDPTAAPDPTAKPAPAPQTGGVLKLAVSDVSAVKYDEVDMANTAAIALAEKINEFSRDMLGRIDEDTFVFSPISVYLALAVLSAGAQDETLNELRAALYPEGMDEAAFNKACGDLLALLTYKSGETFEGEVSPSDAMELDIATLICTDDDYVPAAKVADVAAKYFNGTLASADYSDPTAKDAINDWAEQATKGLVKELIGAPIDPKTVMVLASSIYFSNQWIVEFQVEDNKDATFHGSNGDKTVTLMEHVGLQNYYENDKFQALRLDYQNGAHMDVILPRQGVSVNEALNAAAAADLSSLYSKYEGTFRLPKFTTDFTQDLNGILEDMGMGEMFKGGLAGLVAETPDDLFISNAFQKARIEVDEKGTKAAAVTVMMVCGTSMPLIKGPFEMICDRSFGYLISGSVMGAEQLLFAGAVSDI